MFAAAEAYERQGRLDRAIAEYGDLVQDGQGGGEALMRKALLHRQMGEVNEPARLLERAILAAPHDPYPCMRLGQIEEGLSRHAVAADHYRAAARIAPASDEMRVNLSATYFRLGWLDLAHRTALTLPLDVSDWWAGTRHRGVSGYRSLRRETIEALHNRPRSGAIDTSYHWDLARKLFHLGRLRLARRLCEQLAGTDPYWFWPIWLISDMVGREEGADAAVDYLRSTWPHGYTAEYLEAELHQLHEAGRYVELLERLDAHAGVERSERVHEAAVVALYVLDRPAELERHCLDWMRETPKLATPAAYLALSRSRNNPLNERAGLAKAEPRASRVHLMQFWNTELIPADVQGTMRSWTLRHPHWDQTVFNTQTARALLADRLGPDVVDAFDRCYHPAMMADMFRIAFLSVGGGLYADADEMCLLPMDDVLPDLSAVEVVAPHSGGIPGFVDNNFFGCRAGSLVMKRALADMVEDILLAAREGRRPDIWQVTGPGALTRGVAHYIGMSDKAGAGEVVLLPMQQYRAYVRTDENLSYKRDSASNWRLAELA